MPFLDWLSQSALAEALRGSATLYMFVNAGHILSIGLLIGAIIPLDLRLLGLFRNTPLYAIGPFLSRASLVGILLAVSTGFALFSVRPAEYVENTAFLAKIGLLGLGILNAALLHSGSSWRDTLTADEGVGRTKLFALVSLCVWISAVVAGRWIGFL